jgi:16S rRNA processing protein RimM
LSETRKFITVGKLGRVRGVKGEIYVTPLTDFPERFVGQKEIYIDNRGQWVKFKIESARLMSGRPVLKLEGIDNPEDAARLTNRGLAVTDDELVKLPEGSYFIFDLIGCRVYDGATGNFIGELVDVQRQPANDVYVIKKEDGEEMVLAAIKKFVTSIDIKEKKIIIDQAGLFREK